MQNKEIFTLSSYTEVNPLFCFGRFTVIPLMKELSTFIITIKIGAAPIGDTYMNSAEQVRPKRGN